MAAVILTVGFLALIQGTTLSAALMEQARRQTLAAQILQNEIETLRLADWKTTVSALPTAPTAVGASWNGGSNYLPGDLVTNAGNWYRCILTNSGQTTSNTTYWKLDAPSYSNSLSTTGFAYGANYSITRTVTDVVTGSMREATFTVTWLVNSNRRDENGDPVIFPYTRTSSAYFGKYGLNLTYTRS